MRDGPDAMTVLPTRLRMEPAGAGGLRVRAPAKINLNLLVGPRREDGFHDVDSLVAKVTLYDRVGLHGRSDRDVTFTCAGCDCGPDEANLAYHAARLLMDETGGSGVDIVLAKEIPPGKGLGGGSSDAAATLIGLNELWSLGLSQGELAALAGRLGSDVPLFLGPPAVRVTGRGECVEAIEVHAFVAVLVLPRIACATVEVYQAFDDAPEPMGQQLSPELLQRAPSGWRDLLVNQLSAAASRVQPELADLMAEVHARTGLPVCLTGSGSALFILCDTPAEAQHVLAAADDLDVVAVSMNSW